MARKIDKIFTYPDLYSCLYLEEIGGLTYKEMTKYFTCNVSVSTMYKNFKKYGIKHETKRSMVNKCILEHPEYSIKKVAMVTNVSVDTVCDCRKTLRRKGLL